MKKTHIILIVIPLFWISCSDFFETTVELDVPEHEPKLAVTAELGNAAVPDRPNTILVSHSVGGLEEADETTLINDATVLLNDTELTPTDQDGIYTLPDDFSFTAGSEYTLTVSAPGFEEVTSGQTMPAPVPVYSAGIDNGILSINIHDSGDSTDYYLVKLFKTNNSGDTFKVWLNPYLNTGERNYRGDILFTDELFNGENHNLKIEIGDVYDEGNYSGDYTVFLYHIPEDLYRYYHSLALNYDTHNNPFTEPVFVYQNIENGYGIFALNNITEYGFSAN